MSGDLLELLRAVQAGELQPERAAQQLRGEQASASDFGNGLVQREHLIVRLARMYCGRRYRVAAQIERDAIRFAASWSRLKVNSEAPSYFHGRPEELLFALQRNADASRARWPLKWRAIDGILQLSGMEFAKNSSHADDEAAPGMERPR